MTDMIGAGEWYDDPEKKKENNDMTDMKKMDVENKIIADFQENVQKKIIVEEMMQKCSIKDVKSGEFAECCSDFVSNTIEKKKVLDESINNIIKEE